MAEVVEVSENKSSKCYDFNAPDFAFGICGSNTGLALPSLKNGDTVRVGVLSGRFNSKLVSEIDKEDGNAH